MPQSNSRYIGIGLAVLATIIWSGNFVVARGVSAKIGPVSLAFYRWLTATVIITPIAWKQFRRETVLVKKHLVYLLWTALMGITLFNTFVYVAGHYTSAINLALIGTTASPVFSTIMAAVFLKEKISAARLLGFIFCIGGIVLLLSNGSWQRLAAFHFSKGDIWVITGALAFAIYSILVKRKPAGISSLSFLFIVFALGTLMLFPAFVLETQKTPAPHWDASMAGIILYLGAGASVAAFLCWNTAIEKLGAATTVLFGNLIPVFSVWEATIFLNEALTPLHLAAGILVIAGLVIANLRYRRN